MMSQNRIIAVMQPYIFPYVGYFKMISIVDEFILYDNVQYINRGFINRNKILINGKAKYFNFQIEKEDRFKPIKEVRLKNFNKSRSKFFDQIYFSYKKSPCFDEVFEFIECIFLKDHVFINDLNSDSIINLSLKLDLETGFTKLSHIKNIKFENLKKEQKLNKIINHFHASHIIMPPNSIELYKDWKLPTNCKKQTLKMPDITYKQFSKVFVPNLSIIDVLMFNGFDKTSRLLKN